MFILVINCGSSSFKYQLLEMTRETLLAAGLAERIGQPKSTLTHKKYDADGIEKKFVEEVYFPDHTSALQAVLGLLTHPDKGVIPAAGAIGAIGHRVVQGGELLQQACVVTAEVKEAIARLNPLAPLHNPANLQGIEVAQRLCPHAPSVAVFDTEFHSTIPPEAYMYALPLEFYNELGIRRYGFHGTSHRYVSKAAAAFLRRPLEELNLISCHLGNGCSLTAVAGGKSIETSMGFTPLAGLIMGTRCGDLDAAVPGFLAKNKGLSFAEIDSLLNNQSGLKGLCGLSDMRDIHRARAAGDRKAELAFAMFCYRVKRHIGASWAALGRVDAVIFTAGIGENDPATRAACCAGMEPFGLGVDPVLNEAQERGARRVSPPEARVPVLVIPTNEELEIARTTLAVLQGNS